MKKVKYILIAICCSISNIATSDTEKYILDETHLSIGFLVDHAGYARTLGMFTKAGGSFKYNADTNSYYDEEVTDITGTELEIDAYVLDVSGDDTYIVNGHIVHNK